MTSFHRRGSTPRLLARDYPSARPPSTLRQFNQLLIFHHLAPIFSFSSITPRTLRFALERILSTRFNFGENGENDDALNSERKIVRFITVGLDRAIGGTADLDKIVEGILRRERESIEYLMGQLIRLDNRLRPSAPLREESFSLESASSPVTSFQFTRPSKTFVLPPSPRMKTTPRKSLISLMMINSSENSATKLTRSSFIRPSEVEMINRPRGLIRRDVLLDLSTSTMYREGSEVERVQVPSNSETEAMDDVEEADDVCGCCAHSTEAEDSDGSAGRPLTLAEGQGSISRTEDELACDCRHSSNSTTSSEDEVEKVSTRADETSLGYSEALARRTYLRSVQKRMSHGTTEDQLSPTNLNAFNSSSVRLVQEVLNSNGSCTEDEYLVDQRRRREREKVERKKFELFGLVSETE